MKSLIKEFKEFALKGNAISMAVGIVIGSAFTAIVNSVVNDLINPLLGIIVSENFANLSFSVGGAVFTYGNFIMSVINFLIIAIVMFIVVKGMNTFLDKNKTENAPEEKECPHCMRMIPIGAKRCPECTSMLEEIQ